MLVKPDDAEVPALAELVNELPVAPVRATTPGAVAPVKVVCGFSTETASQTCLSSKSLVRRSCGWRAKAKPGTYWASIDGGVTSLRGEMPLEFNVASDQFWPASRCQPELFQSRVP